MKKYIAFVILLCLGFIQGHLDAQTAGVPKEFGIAAGGFTNFPANKHYLDETISAFCLEPYIRSGRHEFSLGILFPLGTGAMFFSDETLYPRPGAVAEYKYYVFNPEGRENLFIHYAFQYMRFKGTYDLLHSADPYQFTEKDMYINHVIGLGYHLFFDTKGRFGLYYTLDYMISSAGYQVTGPMRDPGYWTTRYLWNHLSTNFGLTFKICPLKKP